MHTLQDDAVVFYCVLAYMQCTGCKNDITGTMYIHKLQYIVSSLVCIVNTANVKSEHFTTLNFCE